MKAQVQCITKINPYRKKDGTMYQVGYQVYLQDFVLGNVFTVISPKMINKAEMLNVKSTTP